MSTLSNVNGAAPPKRNHKLSIALVFVCTLLGAAAQILMKAGTQHHDREGVGALIVAIFTTPTLFAGYALYGISTAVLIVALKYGELSVLYPVIAMTYVWVTALSVFFYQETMNPFKLLGLTTVVLGVAVLGRGFNKTHGGTPAP